MSNIKKENLSIEEKIVLLDVKNFWETQDYEEKSIKSISLADGPSGLRKQIISADHLGLNPSKQRAYLLVQLVPVCGTSK